jgi:aerobic carbon-monoxide dehydrogenase medium subunit
VIRTALRYHRPGSAEEASDLLNEHRGDSAVLGGGTWLLPLMCRGELRVSHVVDLRGMGLDSIRVGADEVEVGAMVTYEDVLASPELADAAPLLGTMAAGVTGGRQLRNQATLVGSACYANPASEVPAVLVALDAVLQVHGPSRPREVAAADFFEGAFATALQPGELVTSFRLPRRRLRTGYAKVKLSAGSWPIATAAAVLDEACGEASVTLGAVERQPLTLAVAGGEPGPGQIEALVADGVSDPWADVLAPADYRRRIAPVVARRAFDRIEEVGG